MAIINTILHSNIQMFRYVDSYNNKIIFSLQNETSFFFDICNICLVNLVQLVGFEMQDLVCKYQSFCSIILSCKIYATHFFNSLYFEYKVLFSNITISERIKFILYSSRISYKQAHIYRCGSRHEIIFPRCCLLLKHIA